MHEALIVLNLVDKVAMPKPPEHLRYQGRGATLFMMMVVRVIRSSRVTACPLLDLAVLVIAVGFATTGIAQTTSTGTGIDLEIINPSDGSNTFCVAPGDTLKARLFIRPGTDTTSCTPSCGSVVNGGATHIATAVVDIAFDNQKLTLVNSINNSGTAAVDGLIQDHAADGRIGWALAGDWTPNADTSGTLATPCEMQLLNSADWVLGAEFTVQPTASGITSLHLRRETDTDGFSLSFADICSSEAFTEANGGIDEIVDGAVLINSSCADLLFFDGFETQNVERWSLTGGT
ncbi:MAG: hypothetical protein DRJ65_00795 [Acidobacteria bacterium]|nr:MAG: hypothetical protein DRJ65_00795 [Acidobacteriota bacterium]